MGHMKGIKISYNLLLIEKFISLEALCWTCARRSCYAFYQKSNHRYSSVSGKRSINPRKDILMSGHTTDNGHLQPDLEHGKEVKKEQQAAQLAASWREEQRWQGIRRPYTPEDVLRLR